MRASDVKGLSGRKRRARHRDGNKEGGTGLGQRIALMTCILHARSEAFAMGSSMCGNRFTI